MPLVDLHFSRSGSKSASWYPDLIAHIKQQHARRYASEAGQSSGSSGIAYGIIGVAALGGGYYYYTSQQKPSLQAEAAGPAKKAFQGGDQGFISLKLENIENVNSNTKKFRFALPEDDMVSGLPVACESRVLFL